MTWFYLALLSVVGSAVANIFRRVAMKNDESDAIASAVIFQFIGAIVVGVFAIWHGFIMPPIAKYPINIILQAILWGSATLFLFKASSYLEASETAIIATLSSVVTILGAMLFLRESFSLIFTIGTILIILSVAYLSYEHKKVSFNKGILFVLGYCLLAGLGYTND